MGVRMLYGHELRAEFIEDGDVLIRILPVT
jgi:hypothetical protein